MSRTVYNNPPINEAVLTIGFKKVDHILKESLVSVNDSFREEFPVKKDIVSYEGDINIGKDIEPELTTNNKHINGYSFWNKEKTRLYQLTKDRFSYNMLKPYTNRNEFVNKAKVIWSEFDHVINPDQISSISLRYINRVLIPLPIEDFKDYISITPKVPEILPDSLNSFFNQVQIPMNDDILVTISTTIEPDRNDQLPYILDIMVTKYGRPSLNKNEFWGDLVDMLDLKNDIFENVITDKTRKLFD